MKKILALFLSVLMVASCSTVCFAARKKCSCGKSPVINVRGFGAVLSVEKEDGTYENALSVDNSELTAFMKTQVKQLVDIALKKDSDAFTKQFYEALDFFFGDLRCDSDGNSIKNIKVQGTDTLEKDTHKGTNVVSIDRREESDGFEYEYDFRLDPMENAKDLNRFINEVKVLTGHDKVSILAHSEGTIVTTAYLKQFGSGSVDRIVFVGAAVKGLSLIGDAVTKNIELGDKADALEEFVATATGSDSSAEFINLLLTALNKVGVLDVMTNSLDLLVDNTIDGLYRDYIIDMFATMPAIWAFVPDEYYEQGKQTMFGDDEKYDMLVEKLDNYHYNIQCKAESILKKAKKNGTAVSLSCGYGTSSIPVSKDEATNSDFLIDTKYTSIGATVAPFGKTIEDADGKYASPDGIVDASTCLFPDSTWFVKYQTHNDFCEPFKQFLTWLLNYDGQPTVESNSDYPQYMICRNHERLDAVTEDDNVLNTGTFFQRLIGALKNFIVLVFGRVTKTTDLVFNIK